ncbi:MAG TPA: zf-HC2 domain-containing protein [Candidatus Polarisedimenticolaceae bacterium]|nr:zf-HC2 domain-containing protein [Candidatus Polarisedimenticolaceae bacterium]
MNCDETTGRVSDRLKRLLDPRSEADLERHLSRCDDCRAEAEAIERVWNEMGRLDDEVPSDRMRSRFHDALAAYERRDAGPAPARGSGRRLGALWARLPGAQLASMAAALSVGMLVGGFWLAPGTGEIEALRFELRSMERAISLTLLEHGSASERLRGVQFSARVEPDSRVVEALLDTVAADPNVSVRLAAVEALAPLLDRRPIAERLVETMAEQSSPLLQVTLAEVLLDAGIEGSRPAVLRLIEHEGTDPAVREHLRGVMRNSG